MVLAKAAGPAIPPLSSADAADPTIPVAPGAPPAGPAPALPAADWPTSFRIHFEPPRVRPPFSASHLTSLLTRSLNLPRALTDDDLVRARRILNDYYEQHDYLNSRAVILDQSISSQTVEITILHGSLAEVHAHAATPPARRYVERRLRAWNHTPLNLRRLADTLETLRKHPAIDGLVADLQPRARPASTTEPAPLDTPPDPSPESECARRKQVAQELERLEAVLDVRVQQAPPWDAEVVASNYRPASVGAEFLEIRAARHQLLAFGDALELEYGLLDRTQDDGVGWSGLDNLGIAYRLPVTVWDTTLAGFYERKGYTVIEEPFNQLDIESEYQGGGLRLRQPLPFLRNARDELTLGLDFERRHSESLLLGEPFGFAAGTSGGASDVSVLRVVGEWTRLEARQALAVRLTGSFGLDVWNATRFPQGRDGEFVSLLGQGHYVRPIPLSADSPVLNEMRLLVRGAFQWANEPLLALEQFALGGPLTVRGYRVNQLVRDRGVLASIELPVSLLRTPDLQLTLGPFFDFGAGEDVRFTSHGPNDLASVGVGFDLTAWQRLRVRVDWGFPFRKLDTSGQDLQDRGLYFLVSYSAFRRP